MKLEKLVLLLIFIAFVQNFIRAQNNYTQVLTTELVENYVQSFNASDEELYKQEFPNSEAFNFMADNIPLFECPDKNVERTYYFRWWTYRKHIKKTPEGYIITEFLPDVPWAGKYNAITCPGTHQFREGRWMRNPVYLQDYTNFWVYHSGFHPNPRWSHFRAVLGHGFPLSDAVLQLHKIHSLEDLIAKILPELTENFEELKRLRKTETGLYWSNANGWLGDGMEVAVGGDGVRPTINSYMYAQAIALSEMHSIQGDDKQAQKYQQEAQEIADLMLKLLWDKKVGFFKVMRMMDIPKRELADVRELLGYVPWYYSIPPKDKGYETAWSQLMDKDGFYAPYGPTTAEQRHPKFTISYKGHECQWNGPSWPYATAQTLTAMGNVIQDYLQNVITRKDYFTHFIIYTNSMVRQKEDGTIVPWIDENLNPYTGEWLARARLINWDNGIWSDEKGGKERGKDYNHSTYVDILITGLIGLKPRLDDTVEVNPVLPEKAWDYFCLDKVYYHGHNLTIIWDKTGEKYNLGKGLVILSDGKEIARSDTLSKTFGKMK